LKVLSASHLTRRFGERLAVEDLSFEVRAGEIFGLLGPNGAGKTTTLRILAGLIAPSSGNAIVAGISLSPQTAADIRSKVGFLTEAPGLWDRLSVWMNLLVYARLYGVADPDAAVRRSLALFGLEERAADHAAQLSKGMKQKVALARALIHDPSIVLLDEPNSGLDPQTTRMVRQLILDLRREHRTIVISTHNLDEAERLADRVAVVRQCLIAVDTPAALRQRLFGRHLRVKLMGEAAAVAPVLTTRFSNAVRCEGDVLLVRVDNRDDIPVIVRMLVTAGAEVCEVVVEEPSLEDVYLKLIGGGAA
jgi:ABC-2 type transport system ATP-binding protein